VIGKVALVTGASRGIGRVTAIALAQAGVAVGVHYVNASEEARASKPRVAAPSRFVVMSPSGRMCADLSMRWNSV